MQATTLEVTHIKRTQRRLSSHCSLELTEYWTLLFQWLETTTLVHRICWDDALPLLRAYPDKAMIVFKLIRS
jgi:hypothetical protein